MSRGRTFPTVAGIIFRRDGEIVSTGQPADITDSGCSCRRRPDIGYDMPRYKLGTLRGRLPFTSIQTMRGCPWKCIFCASEALKTTDMRVRSPRSVVNEMKQVVETVRNQTLLHRRRCDDAWKEHILEIAT